MTIPQADGMTVGNNLFHSFSRFNVPAGARADFQGTGIQNVLARVTGTEISDIQGRIKSSVPGANFFLMNPNGVVFGPGATIDVKGNFAVTTADYIKLADGTKFTAAPAIAETFSTAAPIAFGFLHARTPGNITVNGSQLNPAMLDFTSTAVGRQLLFAAGDTTIKASDPVGTTPARAATITAESGTVKIAAIKSAGELDFAAWDVTSFANLGNVVVQGGDAVNGIQTKIIVGGTQAGRLEVKGDNVTVTKSASLRNEISGANSTGGGGISVEARNTVTLSQNGRLVTQTEGGSGKAAPINLKGSSVMINSNGKAVATTFDDGANAGDIVVDARVLDIDGNADSVGVPGVARSGLYSQSTSSARAGNVTIKNDLGMADSVRIRNNGTINTTARSGGDAGDIAINSTSLSIENTILFAQTLNVGNAGKITIRSSDVTITASTLSSESTGFSPSKNMGLSLWEFPRTGNGGDISITAIKSILISDSHVYSRTEGPAVGGMVSLISPSIKLLNADLDTRSVQDLSSYKNDAAFKVFPGGSGGAVNINLKDSTPGSVELDQASISTTIFGNSSSDNAGSITLYAATLSMSKAVLLAQTYGDGTGGSINIFASGMVKLDLGSLIIVSATDHENLMNRPIVGRSGGVNLLGGDVELKSGAAILAGNRGNGESGNITMTGNSSILFDGTVLDPITLVGVFLDNTSSGKGITGKIKITGGKLTMKNDVTIANTTYDQAAASGGIDLIIDNELNIANGPRIVSGTTAGRKDTGAGISGDITLRAGSIDISDAQITTFSIGPQAGNLDISTTKGDIRLSNFGAIEGRNATGKGGNIVVRSARDLFMDEHAKINAQAFSDGGNLTIQARVVDLNNTSSIVAKSSGAGKGGDLLINSLVYFERGGSFHNNSSALGLPGNVDIRSNFDATSALGLPVVSFARADNRLRLECQRDQPFANTLDLSGASQGAMFSDPTLSVSPFSPASSGRAKEESVKP